MKKNKDAITNAVKVLNEALNGIFGIHENGSGYIAAKYEIVCGDKYGRLIKFVELFPEDMDD